MAGFQTRYKSHSYLVNIAFFAANYSSSYDRGRDESRLYMTFVPFVANSDSDYLL